MRYARPNSMGYLMKFEDVIQPYGCLSEYKYNGWAVGITQDKIETRHGKPLLTIDVRQNLETLREMVDWDFCEMVHAELMCLTPHACPSDTLIVHDCMGGFSSECGLYDRQTFMWLTTPPIFHGGNLMKPLDQYPVKENEYPDWGDTGGVHLPKRVRFFDMDSVGHSPSARDALQEQLRFNAMSRHYFYEGFVHKKVSAHYGAKNAWFKQRIQNQILKYEEISYAE